MYWKWGRILFRRIHALASNSYHIKVIFVDVVNQIKVKYNRNITMTKAEAMLNHQQYSICVFGWSINCVDFVDFTDFVDFAAMSDKFKIDLQ